MGRSGFDIGLFLVEPIENGQGEVLPIATEIDFNSVYCFGFNPLINTPNITVGNDVGLYQGTSFVSVGDDHLPLTADKSSLMIYPNPFNPATTIGYSLINAAHVDVFISNLKGQRVRTLVSEHQNKGEQTHIWDGKDDQGKSVASGIYLCNLIIDGRIEAVNKCLLLK